MNIEQIRDLLCSSPLLRGLEPEAVAKLAAEVRIARWTRNQVVLRKGDPGNAMMIVAKGRVKITSGAENGRERILNIIEPGESFGEIALLDGHPRSADSVALEATTAVIVGRKQFAGLLESNPGFALRVIEDLCKRLRKTTTLVEDSLFLDPGPRLARRIRALIHEIGKPGADGESWVLEGLSQQDLADAVGLTRESVNKLLRSWQAEGIVELERKSVAVRNVERLRRLARADD
jgi:CRP/FNR family cyclic AMP-dependent transcriptional regulator